MSHLKMLGSYVEAPAFAFDCCIHCGAAARPVQLLMGLLIYISRNEGMGDGRLEYGGRSEQVDTAGIPRLASFSIQDDWTVSLATKSS